MYHYRSFSAKQFAEDDSFQRWVKNGASDAELDRIWIAWMTTNADMAEVVEEGRNILLAVYSEHQFIPSKSTKQRLWNRIEHTLSEDDISGNETEVRRAVIRHAPSDSHLLQASWFKWAAATTIVMLASATLYFLNDADKVISSETNTEVVGNEIMHVAKANSQAVTVVLEDGSSVVLQPHSELTYSGHFGTSNRQVTLSGEGFFEITKDRARPFFVKTSYITTRVLGTSFSVRQYPNELSGTVRVKTGNVSVFRHGAAATDSAEVLLSPSQQVVFNVSDEKMIKSPVVEESPLTPVARYSFEFQDAPIREVFNMIKTAYSVEVEYDEAVFSNCSLNASLNDVPFEEKLRLICKAIGAEYKVEGNRVTIFGKGC